jgi:hypothetical protein
MRPIDLLVSELDRESGVTRTLFERLPEDKAAWKPHSKSFSLGDLALHLANLPTWIPATLAHAELDLHPPDGAPQPARAWVSRAALLAEFDGNVAAARAALVAAADAELQAPWTLKNCLRCSARPQTSHSKRTDRNRWPGNCRPGGSL